MNKFKKSRIINWIDAKNIPPINVPLLLCVECIPGDSPTVVQSKLLYGRGEYEDPEMLYFQDQPEPELITHWAYFDLPI